MTELELVRKEVDIDIEQLIASVRNRRQIHRDKFAMQITQYLLHCIFGQPHTQIATANAVVPSTVLFNVRKMEDFRDISAFDDLLFNLESRLQPSK